MAAQGQLGVGGALGVAEPRARRGEAVDVETDDEVLLVRAEQEAELGQWIKNDDAG